MATLAIMFTMTTYGTWLRGDQRGWVDEGVIFPAHPVLEQRDRERMKHSEFLFEEERLLEVGRAMVESMASRLGVAVYAMAVQSWHTHFVVGATMHDVSVVAKCAKDAVRWALRVDRPVWTEGFDKRFCFDWRAVRNRVVYTERHNLERGLVANPYGGVVVGVPGRSGW